MNNTNTTNSNPYAMGTVNLNTGVSTPTQTAQPTTPTVNAIQPSNIPNSQNITTFGTQPINLPTQNSAQITPVISQADRIIQQTAVPETEMQKKDTSLAQTIFDIAPQLAGKTQEKYNAVQTATSALKQRQQDINAQIYQKNAEIQKDDITLASDLDRLQGGGILKSIVNTQQYDIAKKAQITRSLKMADANMLNAQSLALNGQIELAKTTAEDAINAKYSVFEDILNTTKLQREAIQPLLTRDEKKQAREQDIKTNLALDEIKQKKEDEKKANDMIINAMPFAPQSITAAAQKVVKEGGSIVQVAQALGKYAGDFLGNQLKLSAIAENNAQINKIRADIKATQSTLPNNAPVGSTNYSLNTWVNSAKNKNSLTAEERGGISKAFSVVNQIGALNENLKKDQTSFFGGNVKKIMASIGQDADAGTINAQITALVPQVAKGVYGEVGVLTDQDTARYTQTLPNLTSPEKQNAAVTALTLTALRNGVKSKLDVAAASNLDVSGFVPLYNDLNGRINKINDTTGVNDIRVKEILTTNNDPKLQTMVADMVKQGIPSSQILEVLGAE